MSKIFPTHAFDGTIAGEVAQVIQRVPRYAKLTWLLLKDPRLTHKQRTALTAAVGYSISPIDAIPGIIPVIGQLDDLAIMLFTILWVLRSMPAEQAETYLSQSGLSVRILDDDLSMVKRSGVRILKRLMSLMGVAALWVWKTGNLTGRGIWRRLRKRA